MIALAFLCGVAVLFAVVAAWESEPGAAALSTRPAGLLRWLVGGNWPAKLGGALLIVGTGALLRYLMLNIEVPAAGKLMAGVAISAVLGTASAILSANPRRRAIVLALGGACLAVAYLTAYSAYGFFHFVSGLQGLGLLFIVACVATVFAIARRAVSIAVLAMIGAYIAPAFALQASGPVTVYGYYVAASIVTLVMVWRRGWRPLIHLSFLFTLAGALFFGWTQQFYTPAYYQQMQPLLLALVAIHLAMPFFETAHSTSGVQGELWMRRFDQGYFLLLPVVACGLTLLIAPRLRHEGALGLLLLAILWLSAAAVQHLRFHQGGLRYAGVALAEIVIAGLLLLDNVPPFLIGSVVACLLITAGARLQFIEGIKRLVITLALATATCYLLQALFEPVAGVPFLNAPFGRHAVLAAALAAAGFSLRRQHSTFAPVFLTYAATWLVTALARELFRLHFEYVAQILYALSLLAAAGYAVLIRARAPALPPVLLLGAALFFSGLFSAPDFAPLLLFPLMLSGQAVISMLAYVAGRNEKAGEPVAGVARSLLPVLLFPWAAAFDHTLSHPHADVLLTLLVSSALLASLQAQWAAPSGRFWPNVLSPVGFLLFGGLLMFETLFAIERDPWAIAFELIALPYLVITVRFLSISGNRDAHWFSYLTVAAATSVSAAMLLRLIGPPGRLTILALNHLLFPAVLSLLWSAIGGVLTWLSTRTRSRSQWSIGALFLIAAAAKLILFDFGSLGELGNILAMMAAGVVFLLVAWLAPFPPRSEAPADSGHAATAQAEAPSQPPDRPAPGSAGPAPSAANAQDARRAAGFDSPSAESRKAAKAPGPAPAARAVLVKPRSSDDRDWFWVLAALVVIVLYAYFRSHGLQRFADSGIQ
jgi:uncharacterized membrane protein